MSEIYVGSCFGDTCPLATAVLMNMSWAMKIQMIDVAKIMDHPKDHKEVIEEQASKVLEADIQPEVYEEERDGHSSPDNTLMGLLDFVV